MSSLGSHKAIIGFCSKQAKSQRLQQVEQERCTHKTLQDALQRICTIPPLLEELQHEINDWQLFTKGIFTIVLSVHLSPISILSISPLQKKNKHSPVVILHCRSHAI